MSERTRDTYNDPMVDHYGEPVFETVPELTECIERLRGDLRRVRRENQWLRNRRNRAVELLTGDPGPDPEVVEDPVTEDESVPRRQFTREGPADSYPEEPPIPWGHQNYTHGGGGSHWEGCHDTHWDCRIAYLEREVEAYERTLTLKNAGADAVMARQAHELMGQMIPVVRAAVKWRTCHTRDENEKDWLHTLFVVTGEYLDDQEAPTSLDDLRKRVPVTESSENDR